MAGKKYNRPAKPAAYTGQIVFHAEMIIVC